ncbi:Hypothetical protein SMAX5B_020347 [Scophthalmus maximus]|uniref:Uncharacterized protein n=1 Tax=Scophthalmus maximus TaxID=52904 RepID=A0A2U9CL70_SCOMX|nr:Hypothetical protein SMAX5B_020347 [Scophthalmus maximus]
MRAETDNLHRFGCRWLQYERQPDGGVGGGRRETWPAEYQSMSRRILVSLVSRSLVCGRSTSISALRLLLATVGLANQLAVMGS